MKTLLHCSCVLALVLSCAAAPDAAKPPAGCRLTAELADGSRVVGAGDDENYLFKSDVLGEIKLPVDKIRAIEWLAGTNQVVQLTCVGGDTLTVRFEAGEIHVKTTFGRVTLPADKLKRVQVSTAGKRGINRPGLVALWSGEGNADDSVGNRHGKLLNGAGFADGKVGQAFSFSGANQCVEIPYDPELVASNFSVEAWVKPMSQLTPSQHQGIIFGELYGFPHLLIRPGTTGVPVDAVVGTDRSTYYRARSASEIPLGRYSHLIETWDGTTLRLYINGVLSAQNTPGITPVPSGCPFYIGGFYHPVNDDSRSVSQFFDGLIDEVAVYDHALTADEIQTIRKEIQVE